MNKKYILLLTLFSSLSLFLQASLPPVQLPQASSYNHSSSYVAALYADLCRLKINIDTLKSRDATPLDDKRNLFELKDYFANFNPHTCSFLDVVRYSSSMSHDFQWLAQASRNFDRQDVTQEQNQILHILTNSDQLRIIVDRLVQEARTLPSWPNIS